MGVFDNLERRLENVVGGGFARAFKAEVQPVEIAARLQRQLDAGARLLSRDRRVVPNHFVVGLSRHDFDSLVPYSDSINSDIIGQLREYASSQGYVFNGPLVIDFDAVDSLPTGQFTVRVESGATEPAEGGAILVLETAGVRHPLVQPGFTIGRGAEADVRISDPGISRVHARVTVTGPSAQPRIVIEDLGSTNGIVLNGERVRSGELREGSRIELGTTRLLVRRPPGV